MGAATGQPSATRPIRSLSNAASRLPLHREIHPSRRRRPPLPALVSDAAGGGGGGVVMRPTIVASRGACGDGGSIDRQEDEAEEEEEEGCWVSHGRRDPRHRLPPPIPTLATRSTLRRTRTHDRRLVIPRVPVMRPDYYVRSRRRGGRLIMRLVELEDDCHPSPAHDPPPEPSARDVNTAHAGNSNTTAAVLPPSTLPAVGCFEDVVKCQYAIGSSPLHQLPVLRMMVH